MSEVSRATKSFTEAGPDLAFIQAYTRLHIAPRPRPICSNIRRQPPSVHNMILTPERAGFIARQPGVARSIKNAHRSTTPARSALMPRAPIKIAAIRS
jgi:repressor LexA